MPKLLAPTKEIAFEGPNDRWLQIGAAQDDAVTKADTVSLDETIDSILENDLWWEIPESFMEDIEKILAELVLEGLNASATQIEQMRQGPPFVAVAWDVKNPVVVELIEEQAAEMVVNVNNGTKYYLRAMIKEMVEAGFPGPVEALKRIKYDMFGLDPSEASKFTDARIKSIVNYETNKAMSRAGHELRTALGLRSKQWFVNNINPCDICLGNQAKGVVPANFQYDSVFGPTLYPPGHPRTCRCISTAVEREVLALGTEPIDWPFTTVSKGGAGSGNYGHGGRPGSVGGSATKQGHISRVSAMEKLGVKHAARMNAYFKYGMPSVKEGRSRHVKWPEAQQWFDTYTAAGKGKAGVKAANAALAVKKPPPEGSKAPLPPPSTTTASVGSGLVSVNRGGKGKVRAPIENVGNREARVRKQLSALPQSHLDTISSIVERSPQAVAHQLGEKVGPRFNVAGVQATKGGIAGHISLTKGVWRYSHLTHEVAHSVHFAIKGKHYGEVSSLFGNRKARASLNNTINRFYSQAKAGKRKFVTTYAKVDVLEYFAESYENYVHSPGKLKKRDKEFYGVLRDQFFGGVEYGK